MHRVFIEAGQVDEKAHRVVIRGGEVNHIKNVLRMKKGEELDACESISRRLYRCMVEDIGEDEIGCRLCFVKEADTELASRIYLFQGLPKGDKMELIIQKAVELGVAQVIPVACKRSVVRLDKSKAEKKRQRWQLIAEGAASQSRRAYVPDISPVMDIEGALSYSTRVAEHRFIPYELSDPDSMADTRRLFGGVNPGESVAVFIGPEGGFDEEEISLAGESGFKTVSLGRRILRTETAAITVLGWFDYILG